MASSDHLVSSDFIKAVHQKLRDDAKILGPEEAWQKHCTDEENLQKYASAMHNLASNHWETNYKKNYKSSSRVEWIYEFSLKYFNEEEYLKYRQRESEIALKIHQKISDNFNTNIKKHRYKLLDVGSCYNPFQKYPIFEVLPIDIAPATSDVYKCDFLNLNISSHPSIIDSEISELQAESFDIVVFSLLLEYLPSPNLRLLACEKAYNLLTTEGVLIIITPDSKHVGANAKIMKSWRFLLAKIGFSRIKYEKLAYLHCMVFRKSLKPEIPQRWAVLQDQSQFYTEFVIPQDFKKTEEVSDVINNISTLGDDFFEELPFHDAQ